MGQAVEANENHRFAALEQRLSALYRAVSRAMAIGHFKGRHGPLEETAWLHVAIHQLDQMDRLAAGVLDKDVRCLARMRTIVDRSATSPAGRSPANPRRGGHQGRHILEGREPAAVAACALLLDRLATVHRPPYAERTLRYYVDRAAAVQDALDLAAAVDAGSAALDDFADRLAQFNPLPGRPHAVHGAPSAASPISAHALDDVRPRPAVHSHDDVQEGPAAHSHGDVSSEVHAAFAAVLESSRHPQGAVEAAAAACHCDALSAESKSKLEQLSSHLREHETGWRRFLAAIDPASAAPSLVLPARSREQRCVPGQPQFGGRWEVASLRATETDDYCPPAQALHDAGSRAYGRAGADLIKAQNEWINAKLCFDEAGTKKGNCIREEDHGYERCDLEEDQGYERCAREEDQGYRDCCDWWPCSWACDAWTWIKKMVCVLKEWVENWVCVITTWVKKMVCVAWAYVQAVGCAVEHLAKAAVHGAKGLGGIVVGAGLRTVSGFIAKVCEGFGVKPASREVTRLKVVGVHVAVMHTGKVLLFSYDEGVHPVDPGNPADFTAIGDSDRALCALWDFGNGTARYIKLRRNLFCAHQAFTDDGRLFVAGGQFPLPGLLKSLFPPTLLAPGADKDVHLFDPSTEGWTRQGDMQKGRWYPTCVTLPDGRIFITSGTNGWATESGLGRGVQNTWQINDPRTGAVVGPFAFGRDFYLYHLYPFLHVVPTAAAPAGRIFVHFKRTTILFDPASFGWMRVASTVLIERTDGPVTMTAGPTRTGHTQHPYSRTGPGPGTSVLLPLLPQVDGATGAISYPAGRILILGGGGAEKEPDDEDPTDQEPRSDGSTGYDLHSDTEATATAEILDFSTPNPQWRYTKRSMRHGRVMPDSLLLPNGRVLVVGGGSKGQSGGLLAHFTSTDLQGNPDKGATDPVLHPEMFDPQTETWEELCPKTLQRLYHTTAVLLPDARVLVAGHDGALNMPPYDASRYELEIFSPPYLFGDDGQPATRPVIVNAPASAGIAQRFSIQTRSASAITSVVLIRQGSTTHQTNSDQRLVGLAIVRVVGETLEVQMPPTGGYAPPGYYMLFVVDRLGVPSVAHWIRVTPSA